MSMIDSFLGKKSLQRVYRRMFHLALKGMNYGRASDYAHNGEEWLAGAIQQMITSSSAVLFDVGANQGVFAKNLITAWRGLNYQLYAFEPSAKTFALLKREVPDLPYVHLVNQGLGEMPGKVELYSDKEGSGLASVYPRDLSHHRIDFSAHETIELTTLDQFCVDNKIDHIDFLKLDVEGHELAVLKGGHRMIAEGKVQIVQFEFGGCNIDSRTYFRDFFNYFQERYNLHRVLSDGLEPLPTYSEKLEVFQSANYVATRK
jgi:FkbM family methyltransferase